MSTSIGYNNAVMAKQCLQHFSHLPLCSSRLLQFHASWWIQAQWFARRCGSEPVIFGPLHTTRNTWRVKSASEVCSCNHAFPKAWIQQVIMARLEQYVHVDLWCCDQTIFWQQTSKNIDGTYTGYRTKKIFAHHSPDRPSPFLANTGMHTVSRIRFHDFDICIWLIGIRIQ